MEDLPAFDISPRGYLGTGKDNCIPLFSLRPVENKSASNQAGRPIFREVEWVKIYIPGDKTTVVSKKVTDEHRERWPEQYQAFKRGQDQPIIGTPLEQWPIVTRAQVMEFKALQIHTVENLASLSDDAISRIGMGTRDLVERAKAFLVAAEEGARDSQIAAKLEAANQKIDAMAAQIDELATRLEEVTGERVSRETPEPPQEVDFLTPAEMAPTQPVEAEPEHRPKPKKKVKAKKPKPTEDQAA